MHNDTVPSTLHVTHTQRACIAYAAACGTDSDADSHTPLRNLLCTPSSDTHRPLATCSKWRHCCPVCSAPCKTPSPQWQPSTAQKQGTQEQTALLPPTQQQQGSPRVICPPIWCACSVCRTNVAFACSSQAAAAACKKSHSQLESPWTVHKTLARDHANLLAWDLTCLYREPSAVQQNTGPHWFPWSLWAAALRSAFQVLCFVTRCTGRSAQDHEWHWHQ